MYFIRAFYSKIPENQHRPDNSRFIKSLLARKFPLFSHISFHLAQEVTIFAERTVHAY